MKAKEHLQTILVIFLLGSFGVCACSSKTASSTPTLSLEQVTNPGGSDVLVSLDPDGIVFANQYFYPDKH
ncbi:MAG: hypothetical protein WBB69_02505 [Anaerolineales bacterium]